MVTITRSSPQARIVFPHVRYPDARPWRYALHGPGQGDRTACPGCVAGRRLKAGLSSETRPGRKGTAPVPPSRSPQGDDRSGRPPHREKFESTARERGPSTSPNRSRRRTGTKINPVGFEQDSQYDWTEGATGGLVHRMSQPRPPVPRCSLLRGVRQIQHSDRLAPALLACELEPELPVEALGAALSRLPGDIHMRATAPPYFGGH